jgi:dockerin type I repeat protein
MTLRRVVWTTILFSCHFALVVARAAAVVDLDFDAAYMVAASGSTEPVSVFDINGPAPWLYLDLPDAALTSFLAAVQSDWFHEASATKQFSLSNTSFVVQDKYWFSPTAEEWNETKAVGDWHVDAHHSLVELIIIYGGGVGRIWATGKRSLDFTVSSGMTGDFNNDGSVDTADYLVWRKSLGQTGTNLAADGNTDNKIDDEDYGMWRSHYGEMVHADPLATGAVPEPLAAALVVEGLSLMLFRRRPKY